MALKRLLEGSHQIHGKESITENSAKILLKRGLKKHEESEDPDSWEFTRDLRQILSSLSIVLKCLSRENDKIFTVSKGNFQLES